MHLQWQSRPRGEGRGNEHYLTWCAVQRVDEGTGWLREMWTVNRHPLRFDNLYWCSLMIVVYPDNTAVNALLREPMTMARFLGSLKWAVGWLVPLDSHLGFVLGVGAESEWYRELVGIAQQRRVRGVRMEDGV